MKEDPSVDKTLQIDAERFVDLKINVQVSKGYIHS